MGLFDKFKKRDENEKEILKKQIDNLMNSYDKEEIDGKTYLEKMMDLTTSHKKKNKK